MESLQTTNQQQCKSDWTQRERDLAKKFKVEAKLVRLLTEIAQQQVLDRMVMVAMYVMGLATGRNIADALKEASKEKPGE